MAWRWMPICIKTVPAGNRTATTESKAGQKPEGDYTFSPFGRSPSSTSIYQPSDLNACWVETESSQQKNRTGYCGIAGKP
jgi:hypothetical protein